MKNDNQRFTMSKETSDLINALEKTPTGEVLTYEALSDIACGDVRGRCKGFLTSARNYLLKKERILFGVVRNVGIKRVTDTEAIFEGEKGVGAIRRIARRSVSKAVCVADFEALPQEMKVRHNATISMMGAIDLATSPSKVKQVREAVLTSNDRLAIGTTLQLFAK